MTTINTQVKIGKTSLKNPVTVASGTAGYGEELANFIDISKLGAIFTKGLSVKPRPGNKGNRVLETPSGMLNSIGLENVGLEAFLKDKMPFLVKHRAAIIPNIAGHSIEENVELCKVLSNTEHIDSVELNVSCPNVKEGGMTFGTDLVIFTKLLEQVRKATNCNLIVKLSPNVTDIGEFAFRAQEIGIDALSAVNTFLGMKINIQKKKTHFNNKVAGLSGPAIKPLAVRIVYQMFEKVTIPIIGIGGIGTLEDTLEFMLAGASAVQIGTMNMVTPTCALDIINMLPAYMESEEITDISTVIGAAH